MSSVPKCGIITTSKACGTSHRRERDKKHDLMRLWILAVGHARGTSEGALCDDYLSRAVKTGRNMGFTAVAIEELAVSKAKTADARMQDEAERLARRVPDGAHVIMLDAKGKGMTSEGFADML